MHSYRCIALRRRMWIGCHSVRCVNRRTKCHSWIYVQLMCSARLWCDWIFKVVATQWSSGHKTKWKVCSAWPLFAANSYRETFVRSISWVQATADRREANDSVDWRKNRPHAWIRANECEHKIALFTSNQKQTSPRAPTFASSIFLPCIVCSNFCFFFCFVLFRIFVPQILIRSWFTET